MYRTVGGNNKYVILKKRVGKRLNSFSYNTSHNKIVQIGFSQTRFS